MNGHEDAPPTAGSGARKALAELGGAVTCAAEALRAIPDDDEAAAYGCVRDLDTALSGLTDLLRSLPRIARLADPAPAVQERFKQSRTELATKRTELAAYRAALDELADVEKHLDEITADAQHLHDRLTELERAKQTAAEIPGLRAAVQALEQNIAALGTADAPEISARLTAAVGQLSTLTDSQRAAMSETAASMIARAETAARELQELQARRDTAAADLARLESEAEQLLVEHRNTLPMLTAWSKADHELAEILSTNILTTGSTTLETVRAELTGIMRRLTELDDVLGPWLAAHTRAYEEERQVRPP